MSQQQYAPALPGQLQAYPGQHYPFQQGAAPTWPPRQYAAPYGQGYLELGKLGAVIGLCGAGAANLRRWQAEEVTGSEAMIDTMRTGVATGLATAVAALAASQFRGPLLSLAATLATGTAVMYFLSSEARDRSAV